MEIRFISSLTPEDENRIATALLAAAGELLDQAPIAYTIRVATATGKVFQRSHSPAIDEPAGDEPASSAAVLPRSGVGA